MVIELKWGAFVGLNIIMCMGWGMKHRHRILKAHHRFNLRHRGGCMGVHLDERELLMRIVIWRYEILELYSNFAHNLT